VLTAIKQNIDNVLVSSAYCAGEPTDFQPLEHVAGPSVLLNAQDVQSLLDLLRSVTESEVTLGSADPSFVQGAVDPVNISSKCRSSSGDDDHSRSPLAIYSEPRINISIDNDDLNSSFDSLPCPIPTPTPILMSLMMRMSWRLNTSCVTIGEETTSKICELTKWFQPLLSFISFAISISVRFRGARMFMIAEPLDAMFSGCKFALWFYWRGKKPCRTPSPRIINHLKKKGISGFFKEMLWHLLTDAMHFQLISLRKKGKLHLWRW
jgi:hypothetical protein